MASFWDRYTPEQRAYVRKKREKGKQAAWDNATPEQRAERIEKTLKKAWEASRINAARRREAFVEAEVVRINDYAGVITESQLKELNG